MSDYGKCMTCQEWCFLDHHRCKPLYEWQSDEMDHDDWNYVYAIDEESAAEKAAETYDTDDYALLRGGTAEIRVRDPRTGQISEWQVRGESVPRYCADEVPGRAKAEPER